MRTDFDPARFKRGLAREALSHLAHGALYGLGYLPSRHRPERARDIRTVVFVHGLAANRGSFFPLQAYLRLHGYSRQYSFNYSTTGSIERMAIDLKSRLQREIHGGHIDLICHSLGGVVARYFLQMLDGARRVDRLITLASPHHGSYPSVYIPSALLWQLRPDGAFMRHLNAQPPPQGVATTSFAAGQDHLVLPAESGFAPFGETHTYDQLGHLGMLLSPEVFARVLDALQAGEPSAG